jgi:dihydrofolate reductase
VNAAKAIAARNGKNEVFAIGGEAIYKRALPLADRIYLTDVDAAPSGDAFFPVLAEHEWHETSAERFEVSEGNDHAFTIRMLERKLVDAPADA